MSIMDVAYLTGLSSSSFLDICIKNVVKIVVLCIVEINLKHFPVFKYTVISCTFCLSMYFLFLIIPVC